VAREKSIMGTVEATTPAPLTLGRLYTAWNEADGGVRRAALAAVATSWLAAFALSSSASVRLSAGVVGSILVAAAVVDVHERRLPNRLLFAGAITAMGGASLAGDPRTMAAAVFGGFVAGTSMLVVRLARGVGMGDVKAAVVVGASAGSVAVIAAPVAIAVTAFVAAVYGLLAHRARLPLGPSLWIGWVVALFGTSSGWWS
jgi:prepilin peptidase CpaA